MLQTLGRFSSRLLSRGVSQHSTENLGINFSASLTAAARTADGHQGGHSSLFNVDQSCMKQIMQPTPPGDGEVMSEIGEKEEMNQGRKERN